VQSGAPRRIPVVTNPESIPDWYGLPLPGVYIVWALVVLASYYPCAQIGRMKNTTPAWWHSYV
jgi:hypothetical protein